MTDFSVTNYNPYNMYPYYGYNYPSFRGATVPADSASNQSPQVPQLTQQPDSVQFSASGQIKPEEKKGLSKSAKWAIGIGTTVLAGVLAHKFIPPMRVQNRVQRVFLEDFTKEEANAIQKKYQDLLKISDKDEFLDKLFAELKKDYKLEDIPIKLNKEYTGEVSGSIRSVAHFSPNHSKAYLDLGVNKTYDNQILLKHMTHELRHAKQDLACYQVGTREDLISVYKDRLKNVFSKENWPQEKIDENAVNEVDELLKFYDKIGVKKIDTANRNYDWGRKILDSYRTYANDSQEAYHKALYETDAKAAEQLMERMVNNSLF